MHFAALDDGCGNVLMIIDVELEKLPRNSKSDFMQAPESLTDAVRGLAGL